MDRTQFTNQSPGNLVEIDRAHHPLRKDWAFIPNELPPQISFSNELWPLLVKSRDRLGTLNGIGQTLPDPELLLRPLQNNEARASSQIEGTFVTPEQLLMFEMNPKEPKSSNDSSADWQEVFNYSNALTIGAEMMQTRPLGGHVIRSMHSVLMRGVRGRNKSPGQFRKCQVQIDHNARFIPPPATEVERLMQNLENYIAEADEGFDPLVKCFLVHYQFETIHPFEDGNGRIGRALLSLMVSKLLGHSHPWLYLSGFYDRFQKEYFGKMFQVSANGEWESWLGFCLDGTIQQAEDSIQRCHRFNSLKDDYHRRVKDSQTPRTHALIDGLFKNPIVRVTTIKKTFDTTYNTAKHDIEKLVEAGILRQIPNHRPKSFYATEIMDIAYWS